MYQDQALKDCKTFAIDFNTSRSQKFIPLSSLILLMEFSLFLSNQKIKSSTQCHEVAHNPNCCPLHHCLSCHNQQVQGEAKRVKATDKKRRLPESWMLLDARNKRGKREDIVYRSRVLQPYCLGHLRETTTNSNFWVNMGKLTKIVAGDTVQINECT